MRVWCVDAPVGTKQRETLDKSFPHRDPFDTPGRVALAPDPVRDGKWFEFTPEKGGIYRLALDEIRIGKDGVSPTFKGDYQGDPRGAPAETLVFALPATNLVVVKPFTQRIGTAADNATLRLFIDDANVLVTNVEAHGVATPKVDLAPTATPAARVAAGWSEFRDAVRDLGGSTVLAVTGSLSALINNMVVAFDNHLNQDGIHTSEDEVNDVGNAYRSPGSLAAQAKALSRLRQRLRLHMTNDSGEGPGSADPLWHSASDWVNFPHPGCEPSESDPTSVVVSTADTYRALAAHIANTSVHIAAGTKINPDVDELPLLINLHRLFLVQLATQSPTPPLTALAGEATLAALGFKES